MLCCHSSVSEQLSYYIAKFGLAICSDLVKKHCLLTIHVQVTCKTLFANNSRDHSTLAHICSLLGRLLNAKNSKKDFQSCSDFLFTMTTL